MQVLRQTVERILEPRALWSVARITADAQVDAFHPPGRVLLPQEEWRNGSRHTIVLQQICLAPVNYYLQRNENGLAGAMHYNNAGSILDRMKVFIVAPGRYAWSTEDLHPEAFTPKCVCQPSMEFSAFPYASSLFGVSRWDFDFEAPFWLPRQARIQFDLSPWSTPSVNITAGAAYSVLFNELPMAGFAERLPGTARLNPFAALRPAPTTNVFPAGPAPFPPDAFGAAGIALNFTAGSDPFPNKFIANVWDRQESSRGVTHSEYSGFAVLIDQESYDDQIQSIVAMAGEPVTPLANRVSCRARTTNGGSQEWWWRPGVPLSLVTPTIGSALVFDLEKPIVLAPGDALTVEVQAPDPGPVVTQTYQLGVSMLGYARIES